MQRAGELGLEAIAAGRGEWIARLYWHAIEFGLCREGAELRILGAGLASSFGEARQSLEDPAIERRRFEFVMMATLLSGFWSMMSGTFFLMTLRAAGVLA